MSEVHNEILEFTGLNSTPSRCRVRVFLPPAEAQESSYIVLLIDDHDAKGTSITNAAEAIAALVCAKYHLPSDRTTWIKHFVFDTEQRIPFGRTGEFYRVRFEVPTEASARAAYIHGTSLGHPISTLVDRQTVEILIGEPLP